MDKRAIGARALAMRGWTIAGEPPPPDPVVVMIAAPHTSAWDFPLMLWLSWASGVEPHFLAKEELFRGPMGPFMRSVGGLTVDRSNPGGVVDDLVARAATAEHFQLVIAVEGTREKKQYWKSGFYRIAQQADVPMCLGFCDGPTKTVGLRADDPGHRRRPRRHGPHPGLLRRQARGEPGEPDRAAPARGGRAAERADRPCQRGRAISRCGARPWTRRAPPSAPAGAASAAR